VEDAGLNPEIVLEFSGGVLRSLKAEDVYPGYVSGLNDPEVNRYLDGVKRSVQTNQSVTEFVRHNQQAADAVLFGIWQPDAKLHCGTVRLHGIEHFHKTAHIGICLFDRTVWGNRLGSNAVATVTRWAFETMGLRWIEAGVYLENTASQKTFLTAGYEWIYDVSNKYLLEGRPTGIKVYAARNDND
jgi:[ribosomal protein S5]-alanine N-acetyltransferase